MARAGVGYPEHGNVRDSLYRAGVFVFPQAGAGLMATTSTAPAFPQGESAPSHWRSATRRDQAYAVAIGVVLLGCSVFFQGFVVERDIKGKDGAGMEVKVGTER